MSDETSIFVPKKWNKAVRDGALTVIKRFSSVNSICVIPVLQNARSRDRVVLSEINILSLKLQEDQIQNHAV